MKRYLSMLVRGPSLLAFLATFSVYVALVPWLVRVWQRTGDEPHYLLAAHSLAFDGDFDLANNYARRDFAPFYSEYYLDPHTRPGPGGEQVLTHNLGLSILIAPAYRLGGLAGVEYFLAFLGACLAANVFALGYELTGHWLSAAVGWVAIAFTPPVLWYIFLVYPEMVGGLCLIISLRHLLSSGKPGIPRLLLHAFCLAFLPWLSARYLPLCGLLVAWALIRAWKERSRGWFFVALGGLIGLGGYALFSGWLYGSASLAASYAGPTPLAFDTASAGTRFLRGLVGWLLDNQRGVLVASPIYVAAAWGGALLLKRKPLAGAGLLLPFMVMLISVALWGGFWTGWEYSARFLVATLPVLGAGIAYWFGSARRFIVIPVTILLFWASFWVGREVIAQPLKGILSSPVEMLKLQLKTAIDIGDWLPAMGAYKYIAPGQNVSVGTVGGLGWQASRGPSGMVLRQMAIPEFPFGWYSARLPLTTNAAPNTPMATIRIFSPRGGSYFSRTLYGRDVPNGVVTFNFNSPLYDGWTFPPTALVSTTGQADLSLGTLAIEPELFHSLILPALWLIAIALLGALANHRARAPIAWSFPTQWVVPAGGAMTLIAVVSLAWSLQPQPRIYETVYLNSNVGTEISDPAAYGGQAMRADPSAGQEAGMLAATFSEIYSPGRYRLTASLRVDSPADLTLSPAILRIYASDAQFLALRWEIPPSAVPADGHYHLVTFDFENPRQQGLTFILDYTAATALQADTLTVTPVQ